MWAAKTKRMLAILFAVAAIVMAGYLAWYNDRSPNRRQHMVVSGAVVVALIVTALFCIRPAPPLYMRLRDTEVDDILSPITTKRFV